jgi:hypothetical protein
MYRSSGRTKPLFKDDVESVEDLWDGEPTATAGLTPGDDQMPLRC